MQSLGNISECDETVFAIVPATVTFDDNPVADDVAADGERNATLMPGPFILGRIERYPQEEEYTLLAYACNP